MAEPVDPTLRSIIVQDEDGHLYKITADVLQGCKLSEAEAAAERAADQGGIQPAVQQATPSGYVRAAPLGFVATSAFVRAVPSGFVRVVPSASRGQCPLRWCELRRTQARAPGADALWGRPSMSTLRRPRACVLPRLRAPNSAPRHFYNTRRSKAKE